MSHSTESSIAVIGLGYVGLPLAVALAKHFPVTGLDINVSRVNELQQGEDSTGEVAPATLQASSLSITANPEQIRGQKIYIVTVPTPVDHQNIPDLQPLKNASSMVATLIESGSVVVYESTVYPGVTEDVCAPILEKGSKLVAGKDFFLGYSPERINPGDKEHTVEVITKVVAGQTPEVTDLLATVYGKINNNNIFKAANIKTAEASKVIENTQRDINIAFINEVTQIFNKLGLSIYDVLEAAGTKWNFLNFTPGLVGGHCIGVDPYYLAHCAQKMNHEPEVILAGRKINESMSSHIAQMLHLALSEHHIQKPKAKLLLLGLTFKENIPDLRNTKVLELYQSLSKLGYDVDVHDAHADPVEAEEIYNITLKTELTGLGEYDCIIGTVAHNEYLNFDAAQFRSLLMPNGLVADIKHMWHPQQLPEGCQYWSL